MCADVPLGMVTTKDDFYESLTLKSQSADSEVLDDYTMLSGKRRHCTNQARQRTYTFANEKGRALDVTVRTYDDGVAFRYSVAAPQEGEMVTEEMTCFNIEDGKKRWMQPFQQSYEAFYPMTTGRGNEAGKGRWGFPALVQWSDQHFMLVTEANIQHGNCGASMLAKNPTAAGNCSYQVRLDGRYEADKLSPWRIMIVGTLADIVESTLVTDVSEPSDISNTSWIRPAPASWVYWAYNHGSKDYAICKQFVDLAADMHWPYCLIDWEWDRMTGEGDIDDLIAYAKERGVKIFLWYNSSTSWVGPNGPNPMYRLNTPGNRKAEFQWLKEKGIDGIKIDFFKDDSSTSMNYYLDLLGDAAGQQMLITFHGATVPRGWQRTYPNLMTTEAVYGAEWYNNAPVLTDKAACHNATLPFTRNVVGSMDYTPGTFSDTQHKHITTHGHELALYVLFESAIQHMPDRRDVYLALPEEVRLLLSSLPTVWDDTRLIDGFPGHHAVMARQKGDVWYVAGINGTDAPLELAFSLKRLGLKKARITCFADGDYDHEFNIYTPKWSAKQKIAIRARGGFLLKIENGKADTPANAPREARNIFDKLNH